MAQNNTRHVLDRLYKKVWWEGGWVGAWMDWCQSRFKDCLTAIKILAGKYLLSTYLKNGTKIKEWHSSPA